MPAASRSKSKKSQGKSKSRSRVVAKSAEKPLFEKHQNLKLLLAIFCLIELGYFIVYVLLPMK